MNENEANQKVQWMRDNGVLQAQWATHDHTLLMCVLGPPPPPPDMQVGPKDAGTFNEEPTEEELLLMSA